MIQPIRLQGGRIPLLALLALALATLVTVSLARTTADAGPRTETLKPSIAATEPVLAQRAIVQAPVGSTTSCGSGAYVSGDLAGDASPADVYAAMCGGQR
jgi:hypothetical protein